jgi:threonine/homoserine/homoserine lactone efflux protein
MFLFVFSSVFGLHWRQPVFGIALGLGTYVAVKLAEVALLPYAGSTAGAALRVAGIICFNVSMLVWLGYTILPERAAGKAEMPKRAQLEQWNQAIMELIHQ